MTQKIDDLFEGTGSKSEVGMGGNSEGSSALIYLPLFLQHPWTQRGKR